MTDTERDDGVFAQALRDARDISSEYYDDRALRQQWSDKPDDFRRLLDLVRALMEENGGLRLIADVPATTQSIVEAAHTAGRIGAVDGTDAISPTEITSRTVYAAAVISATAQTLSEPRIAMTASHHALPSLNGTGDSLLSFIETLDGYAVDLSWTRTFREHLERQEALRLVREEGCTLALVDGPLYTQNLLTKSVARRGIVKEMLAHPHALIGFIKDMRSAKLLQLVGMALHPGEYWIVEDWRQILQHQARYSLGKMETWLDPSETWIRCVYRKVDRAFAFECHPDLIEVGIAIVNSAICCSDVVGHELPFLLESVDRIVRARMAATAKSENLISASPNFANLTSERTFR